MDEIKNYIESGIVEAYVLGLTTEDEAKEVEAMASKHDEVKTAMDKFSRLVEVDISEKTVQPGRMVRSSVLASFDYLARIEKGEVRSAPPLLHAGSTIEDYKPWLTREDMILPYDAKDIYVKILAAGSKVTSVIVWIKESSPSEVHTNELESFLIVEGTCDLIMGGSVRHLVPGDFVSIPLFVDHHINVTSDVWCKAILQRVAA